MPDKDPITTTLTFSQRQGYEDLPAPMQLEELSNDLRREIGNTVREFLLSRKIWLGDKAGFEGENGRLIERVIGRYLRQPEERISTEYDATEEFFRECIEREEFNNVLDLVQFLVNDPCVRNTFDGDILVRKIKTLFEQHGAAYRLDTVQFPFEFFPCATREQCDATQRDLEAVRNSGIAGVSTHLREAATHINNRQFADSIADSILAVESVACSISPKETDSLRLALIQLEESGHLKHPALKSALLKFYGYTSDEKGIRHALIETDAPAVSVDEALLMFGACASFCAYLASKYQKMLGS